jgi:hypothetical protein
MPKVEIDVDWEIGKPATTVDIDKCSKNVTLNPDKHHIDSGPRYVGESDAPKAG